MLNNTDKLLLSMPGLSRVSGRADIVSAISIDLPETMNPLDKNQIIVKLKSGEFYERERPNARSDAWKRFREVADKSGKSINVARCKTCKILLRCPGKTGTGSLMRHVCKLSPDPNSVKSILNKNTQRPAAIPVDAKRKFDMAYTQLCIKHVNLFEVMQNVEFQNFVRATLELGSKFGNVKETVPDSLSVGQNILTISKDLKQLVKERISRGLLKFDGAISSHLWTDKVGNQYLALVAHFIDDNWQLSEIILGIYGWIEAPQNCNGYITQALREFGLDIGNVIFISDHKLDFLASQLGHCRVKCFSPSLYTVLENIFESHDHSCPDLAMILACNSLVSHIKRNPAGANHLSMEMIRSNHQPKAQSYQLITANFKSAKSILENLDEILLILNEQSEFNSSTRQSSLQNFHQIMTQFKMAIFEIEAPKNYPTSPLIVLWYQKLLNVVSPNLDDPIFISSLKGKLMEELRNAQLEDVFLVATVFHPSFRKLDLQFLTEHHKRSAFNFIRRMLEKQTLENDNDKKTDKASTHLAADSFLDEFFVPNSEHCDVDELEKYLSAPITQVSFEKLLDWWKNEEKTYPKLARIARKFLAVPTSTAFAKNIFQRDQVIESLKDSFDTDIISELLFVRNINI